MRVAAKGAARAEISAVVTRADGSVEDLGMIAYYDRNPLKVLLWRVKQWFRKFKT